MSQTWNVENIILISTKYFIPQMYGIAVYERLQAVLETGFEGPTIMIVSIILRKHLDMLTPCSRVIVSV